VPGVPTAVLEGKVREEVTAVTVVVGPCGVGRVVVIAVLVDDERKGLLKLLLPALVLAAVAPVRERVCTLVPLHRAL